MSDTPDSRRIVGDYIAALWPLPAVASFWFLPFGWAISLAFLVAAFGHILTDQALATSAKVRITVCWIAALVIGGYSL